MKASLFALTLAAGTTAALPASAAGAPGSTVYFGTVFPLEGAATTPTYVYERTVAERDGLLESTHVTRDPSGATAIHESATHSADYALVTYTLHANQLGQTGTIRVDGERVSFERVDAAGRRRTRDERVAAPVVVGPTLVGHIARNLAALRSGRVLPVRFAVLDRLETLGFELEAVEFGPVQTRVRMRPSSLLLRLFVDPIDFTFDTAAAKLVHLEGRVPPKVRDGEGWRDLDARVEYRYVAAAYR
jgi:hypothetical protein